MADADAIQSFLSTYKQSETAAPTSSNIPHQRPICCCGNAACVFLKQNESALEGLERDVRTAAKLGQVSGIPVSCCECECEGEGEDLIAGFARALVCRVRS